MTRIISQQTNAVNERFLRRLVQWYSPRVFTKETNQFDIGYEQAKKDLRAILAQEVPNLEDYEPKVHQKPVRSKWLFGKRR